MIEQILVCDCQIYRSLVYNCQTRANSENVFMRANTTALNNSQMGTILVSLVWE